MGNKSTPKLSGTKIIKIKDAVLRRFQENDHMVVLNMEDQRLYSLKGWGCYLFLMLNGTSTIDEIIQRCTQDLKVSKNILIPKVHAFIEDVFLKNLVEVVNKKLKSPPISLELKKNLLSNNIKSLKKPQPLSLHAIAGSAGCGGSCGSAGSSGSAGSTIGGAGGSSGSASYGCSDGAN